MDTMFRRCLFCAVATSLTAQLAGAVSAPPAAAATAVAVHVYPQTRYQTVEGWGTSLAWWTEATGPWSLSNRQALADRLFDPVKGIGLNVARYNIGGYTPSDTTACPSPFRVGGAVPSYEPTSGMYDWSQDPGQRWWLQAARDRGASQVSGIAYSPPGWMTVSGCSAGANRSRTDNLAAANYPAFATYLATIARHFHDSFGLTLSSIAPFNEPDASWTDTGSSLQEGMYLAPGSQNALTKVVHDRLSADGVLQYSHLSAPESLDSDHVTSWLSGPGAAYDATAISDIVQVDTHDYANREGGSAYGTAQRLGKRLQMSEWGTGALSASADEMSAGLSLSERILKNQREMHPSSWVIWQALDGGSNAGSINDVWGLAFADLGPSSNQVVSYPARFWVMGNYSKFVRPGATVIANSDVNTLTAYDAGTSTLTLVTTNAGTAPMDYSYDLSTFGATGAAATPYRTSATEQLSQLAPVPIMNGSLAASLPARSVTTFVLPGVNFGGAGAPAEVDDATQGTGLAQFDYRGSGWHHCSGTACGDPQDLYGGTTSWDGTAGDSVTFRFSGVRLGLYGVVDNNEGIGSVSVDGGPASEVDFYSKQRRGNSLVWESEPLSAGAHTVTISVSGARNPQSSNAWIALDRAEAWPAPVGAPGSLVTETVTGTIRSDFTGEVGMEFTTGANPIVASALGRTSMAADTQPHTVSLYRASDGSLIASASAPVGAAAPDGLGFVYGRLSSPVTLAANTSYVLLSSETSGGDSWFDLDTSVRLASGARTEGPAYRPSGGGPFTVYTSVPGASYGPVNLLAR
jgi:O-glycosyl hydrolase